MTESASIRPGLPTVSKKSQISSGLVVQTNRTAWRFHHRDAVDAKGLVPQVFEGDAPEKQRGLFPHRKLYPIAQLTSGRAAFEADLENRPLVGNGSFRPR